MAQLRLRDFFKVKGPLSGSDSPIDITLADRPEAEHGDNISFHSFTVFKSIDDRPQTGLINDASTTILSEHKSKPKKITDFDEFMLDKELVAMTPSAVDKSPVPELTSRPQVRLPFHQLQLKQGAGNKNPKLDDFFKSKIVVNKVAFMLNRAQRILERGSIIKPKKKLKINPRYPTRLWSHQES